MEKLWTEKELAAYIVQSVLTIRRNRTAAPHRHPPFKKFGSSVRYDPAEVREWLASQTVNGGGAPETKNAKEKRPLPGRPPKTETIRKNKNAGK